jgi:hypothetical protein
LAVGLATPERLEPFSDLKHFFISLSTYLDWSQDGKVLLGYLSWHGYFSLFVNRANL